MTTIAGLVLGAGGGSRFGGPKILARLGERYLVEYVIEALEAGGCRPPIAVVAGAGWDEAIAALPHLHLIRNRTWTEGLSSSLRTGLHALARSRVDAAVVALCDQPEISPIAVGRVIRAFRDGARIAAARYGPRRGHPVLLARECWSEVIERARGDEGARALMRLRPELVVEAWCDDLPTPTDIDTSADLQAVASRFPRTPAD